MGVCWAVPFRLTVVLFDSPTDALLSSPWIGVTYIDDSIGNHQLHNREEIRLTTLASCAG